jgi:hypothetical protein
MQMDLALSHIFQGNVVIKNLKMKKISLILTIAFGLLKITNAQTNIIDCNNVTYYEDTFYVSLNNNMISNTIFYNDSSSMIYPIHCLVLDDSSLISISYHTGLFSTGDNCHIFTHLTQNSTRDTLDFDFEVTFISNNFSNNTVVNGNLVLSDVNSTCINPITIILHNGTLNSTEIIIERDKKLMKTIDFLGREIKPKPNIPFIEIYDDGSVEKKIYKLVK